ncbi:MAG: hypothetical protein JSW54_02880 [Fidelibacterota bacterium]|nr:MAG: hypothetical protein JSW54_02880 [Candidatus Neomarinimicrobiota bacterium]
MDRDIKAGRIILILTTLCCTSVMLGQDENKTLSNSKIHWRVPAGHHEGRLSHDREYDVYGSRRMVSFWGIVLAAKQFKECDNCETVPYAAAQTLYKQEALNTSIFPVEVGGDRIKKYWRDPYPDLWVYDISGNDRNWNAQDLDRNDYFDSSIPSDQMVTSTINSSLGLTVTQNAYIWTNPDYEDMIIVEYILTNTGNYDADAEVENSSNQLQEVYIGFQSMSQISGLGPWVVTQNTGILTGNDDWVDYYGEAAGDSLKVMYSWDGDAGITFAAENDEGDPLPFTGQPLSPQYFGRAVMYAQKAVDDLSNDPDQPATTHYGHWGSGGDMIVRSGTVEGDENVYNKLSSGEHITAPFDTTIWATGEEDAYFGVFSSNEHLKTATMAFGPYTFTAINQSIRIVTCLAVGSISFERAIEIGQYPGPGSIDYMREVRSGRDSLFAVVSRAKRAFYDPVGGWDYSLEKGSAIDLNIKDPLPAPSVHYAADSGHVRITWEDLSQTPDPDTGIRDWAGYRVYRRESPLFDLIDPTAEIVMELYESAPGDTATHFEDYDVVLGRVYWYMVTAFDQDRIESHRFLNRAEPGGVGQENDEGTGPILPPASELKAVVVVPNPYHTHAARLNGIMPDHLMFVNLPYDCRIRIYNQTGDLIKTRNKGVEMGTGSWDWNHYSDAETRIVSGLYIFVVDQAEDEYGRPLGGGPLIGKFVIIR